MSGHRKPAALFADVDLAFCRIFAKHDQAETRACIARGRVMGADDIPVTDRRRIADQVVAELAAVVLRR